MRKFLAIFLSVYLLFAALTPARAQSGARLNLFALQTASFPSITAGLDVFDAAGNFVTGLAPEAITLLEDNQPRPRRDSGGASGDDRGIFRRPDCLPAQSAESCLKPGNPVQRPGHGL
ncbi:MAG: hypothetical protein NTV38_09955 [Chloroflexi bacterium]|nr:hypothetical protein [Chloroflexota bacterium]